MTYRIGQLVRLLRDSQFRIAIVVDVFSGGSQVLVCKWLNNGGTWTQPRMERAADLGSIDIAKITPTQKAAVTRARNDVTRRRGEVIYRGGAHRLHGAEVSP